MNIELVPFSCRNQMGEHEEDAGERNLQVRRSLLMPIPLFGRNMGCVLIDKKALCSVRKKNEIKTIYSDQYFILRNMIPVLPLENKI